MESLKWILEDQASLKERLKCIWCSCHPQLSSRGTVLNGLTENFMEIPCNSMTMPNPWTGGHPLVNHHLVMLCQKLDRWWMSGYSWRKLHHWRYSLNIISRRQKCSFCSYLFNEHQTTQTILDLLAKYILDYQVSTVMSWLSALQKTVHTSTYHNVFVDMFLFTVIIIILIIRIMTTIEPFS